VRFFAGVGFPPVHLFFLQEELTCSAFWSERVL